MSAQRWGLATGRDGKEMPMALDPKFAELYDELTEEVEAAIYPDTQECLGEWFHALDSEPSVFTSIKKLVEGVDIDQWWIVNVHANHSRQDLQWPPEPDKALAMRLLLMRELARKRDGIDIALFGMHVFFHERGDGPEETAARAIERAFSPMARRLRRYLAQETGKAPVASVDEPDKREPLPIPIIDRDVHNPTAGKLFISYRRQDSAPYAGRVGDRLKQEFGRNSVFMDVGAIPLGADFVQVLRQAVTSCDVLLAIIGRSWLDITDTEGRRRLDIPDDLVRVEIGTALERNIPVIPILLDGTSVPKIDELPPDLRELAHRNGIDVRHTSFDRDMDELIDQLKTLRDVRAS